MTISSHLFEAFLKCPMKCWLRATNERPTRNAYVEWLQTESESYRRAEAKQLIAKLPSGEYVIAPRINQGDENESSSRELKAAKWRIAIDVPLTINAHPMVSHPSNAKDQSSPTSPSSNHNVKHWSGRSIESCLHAIE